MFFMKVIYAVPIELDTPGGNVQHVLGICRHAAKFGIEIHLICLKGRGLLPKENFKITAIPSIGLSAFQRIKIFSKEALAIIDNEDKPAWIYFRPFPLDYLFFTRHIIYRKINYAYELNTLWRDELLSKGSHFKAYLYPYFESLSLKQANALLPVTQEIADYARMSCNKEIPCLVAGNGIDIPTSPVRTMNELRTKWKLPLDKKLAIMAGFTRPWHGREKLISAIHFLPSNWEIVLIGSESAELTAQIQDNLKAMGLSGRVHILPWLTHQDVDEVVWASDVGISPLALEAKKMKEAQSLKVRHYLAMGLPVVIAGGEAKKILAQSFVRQLNDVTAQNIAKAIIELGDNYQRDSIQQFAKKELSWESVSGQTFAFLKEIVKSGPS
jgi:glycosyltransferase involved in cell wall biosynthesis